MQPIKALSSKQKLINQINQCLEWRVAQGGDNPIDHLATNLTDHQTNRLTDQPTNKVSSESLPRTWRVFPPIGNVSNARGSGVLDASRNTEWLRKLNSLSENNGSRESL